MSLAWRSPVKKNGALNPIQGLGVTLVVVLLFFLPLSLFEVAQGKLYDLSLRIRGSAPTPKGLTIVAIDDRSVAQIGRWPWPRTKVVELINRLSKAGAKIIAFDIVFSPNGAERSTGNDRLFGEATREAGNVLYPIYFTLGKSGGEGKKTEIPPQIANASLLLFDDPRRFLEFPPLSGTEVSAPIPEICEGARALGHISVLPDPDGKVRWDPLIVEYAGQYYPSFGLQIAAAAMRLTRRDITVRVGESVQVGKIKIPTNPQGMMLLNYYGGNQTFPYISCADVLSGKVPAKTFRGKIILVGMTAAGLSAGAHDFMATPFSNQFPDVEKNAHEVASILQGRSISRPSWAPFTEFGLVLLIGLLLTFFMPRQRPAWQLTVSLAILLALGGTMVWAIFGGMWIKMFFPGLVVVLQYLLATAHRRGTLGKESVPETGAPGVSAPVGAPGPEADQTVRLEGGGPVRKIGRYEILSELGHGAMGFVFKGRDPIIDRLVAIKTVRFDRLYEDQEIESLKERFYKEAQAAGKFTHPNIVTIFDVGEEEGLSYMAMEYVKGESLSKYTSGDHLLPVEEVLNIIIEVAEALDFAHQRDIVHRDIKPANLMRTAEGEVKVMDFGIAKLPSSTLTQTGSILGTPSYMSPEQIDGRRRIDGRSDLFSLGCVLYELLSGSKAFKGATLPALIHQITQVVPPPVSSQNPRVPKACDEIIYKALAKNPEERYQRGNEMAAVLRNVLQEIKENLLLG
jgi:CHASE2 domain-containing sensor protein/tRNA A-37 threonylcarbamoyl transferase component Bud32